MGVVSGQATKWRKRLEGDKKIVDDALRKDAYGAQPGLSIPQLAALLGESPENLYKQLSGERKFPLGAIGMLQELVGTSYTIEAICRICGVVPKHLPAPDRKTCIHEAAPEVLKEVGEALRAMGIAASGHHLTEEELNNVRSEIWDAIQRLVNAEAAFEALYMAGPGHSASTLAGAEGMAG